MRLILFLALTIISSACAQLNLIAEWKKVEFELPADVRDDAIKSGVYKIGAALPFDVDVDYNSVRKTRVFVTFPRSEGVPIALGYISKTSGDNGQLIKPYPDYTWHNGARGKCKGITNVFRIAVSNDL